MNKDNNILEQSNEGAKDANFDRFRALEESVNDIFSSKPASSKNNATGVFTAVKSTPLFDYSDTAPTLEYARPSVEYKMGDTQDIELPKVKDAGVQEPFLQEEILSEEPQKIADEYDNLSKLFEFEDEPITKDTVSFEELSGKSYEAPKKILANDDEIASVFGDEIVAIRETAEPKSLKNKTVKVELDREQEEFESAEQAPAIAKNLKLRVVSSLSSMFFVFLLTLVCLYVEFAPSLNLVHFSFLEPGRYGAVYALACLQIMFFACMLCIEPIYFGALKLLHGKASAQSTASVVLVIITIHTLVSAIFKSAYTDMPLFCSVGCFCVLLLSVYEFFKARTLLLNFKVASASADKFVISEECDENTALYVPQNLNVAEVKKTKLVTDFFKKQKSVNKFESKISLVILIGVCLGIVCGVIYAVINKDAFAGFNNAVSIMLTVIPAGVFIAGVLPLFIFSGSMYKKGTAIVGSTVPEAYDETELLAFNDTELFPPSSVRVSNFRTYGKTTMDGAIVTMAKVFSAVGGPLCEVFKNSLQNISTAADVSIVDVASDGLWVELNSEPVFVGSASYFAANGFDAPVDNIDNSFEQSLGSILYLAVNNQLAAKFYVKYTLSLGFENTLAALKQNGITAAVKSYDPCINKEFIKAHLDKDDYSICVVKGDCEARAILPAQKSDAMLVSVFSEKNLLKAFIGMQKLRMAMNSNFILMYVGSLLGFIVSALLLFVSSASLGSGFVLAFQLFWILALTLVSFIYK